MSAGLTPRERQVLAHLEAQPVRRYSPTVREIAEAVGLRSTHSVQLRLDALERKGFIRRDPRKARTIEVLEVAAP